MICRRAGTEATSIIELCRKGVGLMAIAEQYLADGRTGRNGRHDLLSMLRRPRASRHYLIRPTYGAPWAELKRISSDISMLAKPTFR